MRHRITSGVTGLGNPDPVLLDNKGKINKVFANEVIDTFFKGDGCDFKVTKKGVTLGIEPAYQYEKLRIIHIDKNIGESYYWYATAFGYYGSKLVGKKKFYKDYKFNSKFKRLVDKYHAVLFKDKK
jgi:hypothetical protein